MTRTVVGIVVATFFSDVGHEMVTAVLPLYLAGVGLGPAALGALEGAADLAFSLSKLAGGAVGHRAARKRPWATAGYPATTLGTGAIALVRGFPAVIALRTIAWFGRGFRSRRRDFLLADEVGPTHFGRAYGLERSADMIGAVVGPLVAAGRVWAGGDFARGDPVERDPVGVIAIARLTRDRAVPRVSARGPMPGGGLPRAYWWFVVGVFVFGLGDFSRTFLIFLAAKALGGPGGASGVLSTAVLLYAATISSARLPPIPRAGSATRDRSRSAWSPATRSA